ncbi:MAG: hypothetical protein ACJARS_002034 [bacterium]|jgi:hypothetical protein
MRKAAVKIYGGLSMLAPDWRPTLREPNEWVAGVPHTLWFNKASLHSLSSEKNHGWRPRTPELWTGPGTRL